MVSDQEKENKVIKYAKENNYTILANTHGALEYVKYDIVKSRMTTFMKWPKGSDTVMLSIDGNVTKVEIDKLN